MAQPSFPLPARSLASLASLATVVYRNASGHSELLTYPRLVPKRDRRETLEERRATRRGGRRSTDQLPSPAAEVGVRTAARRPRRDDRHAGAQETPMR